MIDEICGFTAHGIGSFGIVVSALDLQENKKVAVKIIKNKRAFYKQGVIEVRILKELNQRDSTDKKCVLRLISVFDMRGHLCIVNELLNMSLYDLLRINSFQGLSMNLIRKFAYQIFTALAFLSSPPRVGILRLPCRHHHQHCSFL